MARLAGRRCARCVALAGIVAGSLLLTPTPAGAAPRDRQAARPAASAAAPAGARPRVSPYAAAARRAQAASGAGRSPAVPPSKQRTRRAINRMPSR